MDSERVVGGVGAVGYGHILPRLMVGRRVMESMS